jgi:hypothetical protein
VGRVIFKKKQGQPSLLADLVELVEPTAVEISELRFENY